MGGRSWTRALLSLLLLLAACSDDGSPSASPEATTTTRPSMLGAETTTTSPTSSSRQDTTVWTSEHPHFPCSVTGTSPRVYDPAAGQYAVALTGLDVPERSISFDVIQLLDGEAANEAYYRDFPDAPPGGVPNDVYSINEGPTVRTASVAADVVVRLVRLREDADADLDAGTFDELPAYVDYWNPDGPRRSANPFWLTIRDGTVTDICEQYVP